MDDPTMLTNLPEMISFDSFFQSDFLVPLILRGSKALLGVDRDQLPPGMTEQLVSVIRKCRKEFEQSSLEKYGVDLRKSSIFKYRDNLILFADWILAGFPENEEYWQPLQKKQGFPEQDITPQMFDDLLTILRSEAKDKADLLHNAELQKIQRRFNAQPQEIVKQIKECLQGLQPDTAAQPQLRSQVWLPSPQTMVKPDEHAAESAEDSNLPEHSSLVTNRDSLLETVHRKLNNSAQQNNLLVLWGIGGIGKSELAKLYAQKYNSDYTAADGTKNICFVSCATSLFASIAALPFTNFNEEEYQKLGLLAVYNAKLSLLRESATKGEKLLLVLDNLEMSNDAPLSDREVFSNLCGLPQNLHIIITRRSKPDYLCCQEVEALEEKDALALFYSYYPFGAAPDRRAANEGTIKTILQEIRSNTLMIKLCASLLQKRSTGSKALTPEALLANLLEAHVSQHQEKIRHYSNVFGETEESRTLLGHLLNIFAVAALNDTEKDVLCHLSLLPPEGLQEGDLLELCGWEDNEQYRESLDNLVAANWLQYQESEALISMHPVISLLCYEELQPDADNCEQLVGGLRGYIRFDNYQQKDMAFNFEERERLLRIGTFFAGRIHGENISLGSFFNTLGYDLNAMGKYEAALEYCRKDLAICEEVLGTRHPDTATSYNNTGSVYHDMGNYEAAMKNYRKAMVIWEEVLGKSHLLTATSYNNIGCVYDDMGNNKAALEYYMKALAISEEVLGTRHPNTATSYNNIGSVYDNMGNNEAALEYYMKALAIHEEVLGTRHPSTATIYNNIAGVYKAMGNNDAALEFLQKALAIHEEVMGTRHPDTATSYNNIGSVYNVMGNYETALENYRKALIIREEVLDTRHPDTATSYNNIGLIYKKMGNYEAALEFYLKATAIFEEVLGTNHPSTAMVYNNIAVVYYARGNYEAALEFYWKALTISEEILGTRHPDTAMSYNNIGLVYDSMGNYETALEYHRKALAIREEKLGTRHPNTAMSYNNIGLVYKAMGNYEVALEHYFKATATFEEVLGTRHPDTAISYNNLARAYYNMKKYQQALDYELRTVNIRENVVGRDHPDTIDAYGGLAVIYLALGQSEEAAVYEAKYKAGRKKS